MLLSEISANKGIKSKYVVLSYRLANWTSKRSLFLKLLLFPLILQYKFIVDFVLGIEIPYTINIGHGLKIMHAKCITIHPNTSIGKNLLLRHSTTIGNKNTGHPEAPVIGDNVDIGCNSSILGPIKIGSNVTIGAHSLVLSDISSNNIAYGIPAKPRK